ncbi:MAG: hypothetical protein Q7R33_03705, partial [Nitrosarchaeum sp.]|nr:hypothetical protein [Nitrosarchaeum sp.]
MNSAYADYQVPVYDYDLDGNLRGTSYVTIPSNPILPCWVSPSQPHCNSTAPDNEIIPTDEPVIKKKNNDKKQNSNIVS